MVDTTEPDALDGVADSWAIGEVEPAALGGLQDPGRDELLIDIHNPVGIDTQVMVLDRAGPGQIPVGVVGERNRCRSIGRGRPGEAEPVGLQRPDDLDIEVAWIASFALEAMQAEVDCRFDGIGLERPETLPEAGRAPVEVMLAFVGDEIVTMPVDREAGTADPVRDWAYGCLLYTSPSPRDRTRSRMPSSA